MGCCFGSPSYETPPLQAVSVWLSDPANDNDDTTKKHLAPAAHIDVHGQLVDDTHGGRVFDEAYYTARQDAQAAADAMRAAAAEADAAYNRGAKADAHKHSEEKKRHRAAMDSANAAAAAAVLDPQAWRTSPKIDLHGLYVAEAEAATRAFLDAHRPSAEGHHHMHGAAAESSLELEIVTGAGHHSKDHRAKVRPAIEAVLRDRKVAFRDAHGGGAFVVAASSAVPRAALAALAGDHGYDE